jgi:hypothetical protein
MFSFCISNNINDIMTANRSRSPITTLRIISVKKLNNRTARKKNTANHQLSFIFGGIVYCLFVIFLLTAKVRRPNAMRYILHNIGYVCFLFVFSICLFVDFFMTQVSVAHDNIALIIAIIAGWWFDEDGVHSRRERK